MRIVPRNFVVWCGRTRHFCKKTVFDHTCAVFHAVKPLQNWAKSEGDRKSDPLSGTSHHSENHQTLQFSILLRLHTDLSKNNVMIMHFCFMLAFVFLTFSAKRCFRKPRLRKATALAQQRPQITLQFFSKTFTISTLRPSSQDFRRFGHPSNTF